jgi:hypothetical protein
LTTIPSCRRSMQPTAGSEHAICGRCIPPLPAQAQDRRVLGRTPSGARVNPAEQAGPEGVAQQPGRPNDVLGL